MKNKHLLICGIANIIIWDGLGIFFLCIDRIGCMICSIIFGIQGPVLFIYSLLKILENRIYLYNKLTGMAWLLEFDSWIFRNIK